MSLGILNFSKLNYANSTTLLEEESSLLKQREIFTTIRNTLINQGVVFFGGYANTLYSQYMPANLRKKLENIADFDVLSNNPQETSEIVKEREAYVSFPDRHAPGA